jgi:hypothetical protein
MTQDTTNKFAAILAAAQEKANLQATPKFTAPVKPAPVKDFDNLQDIEKAAKNGEVISLLNLSNLVNQKQPEPVNTAQELSTFTIEDILTGCEPAEDEPQTHTEPNKAFKIVDYSDRSFAIITETKPAEDILNIFRLHGTYNPHLKCGKGWIFGKRHLNTVKAKLSL